MFLLQLPSERPTENETPVFRRKTQLQRKKVVPVVLSTNHSLKHFREGSDSGSGSECWQTWNVLIPWLCVSPVRQFVTAYVDFKKTRVPGGQKKKHTVHSFSCHVDTSASRFKANVREFNWLGFVIGTVCLFFQYLITDFCWSLCCWSPTLLSI